MKSHVPAWIFPHDYVAYQEATELGMGLTNFFTKQWGGDLEDEAVLSPDIEVVDLLDVEGEEGDLEFNDTRFFGGSGPESGICGIYHFLSRRDRGIWSTLSPMPLYITVSVCILVILTRMSRCVHDCQNLRILCSSLILKCCALVASTPCWTSGIHVELFQQYFNQTKVEVGTNKDGF